MKQIVDEMAMYVLECCSSALSKGYAAGGHPWKAFGSSAEFSAAWALAEEPADGCVG